MNQSKPLSSFVRAIRVFARPVLGGAIAPFRAAIAALVVAPSMHAEEVLPQPDPAMSVASQHGRYSAAYASSLEPLAINQMHSWVIQLRSAEGKPVDNAELSISGGMPAHDHGLPTAPRATDHLGGGNYLVEGMKFHMGGAWQVVVHINAAGGADTVTWEVHL